MPNPIVHWEVPAKDPAKLSSFYQDLFGWHVDANNPMNYGMVDTHAEGGINGGIPAIDENTPAGVIIYVEVPDLQAALDKAVRLGAQVVTPPVEVPNMVTFAKFRDPEGNVIGLVKEEARD